MSRLCYISETLIVFSAHISTQLSSNHFLSSVSDPLILLTPPLCRGVPVVLGGVSAVLKRNRSAGVTLGGTVCLFLAVKGNLMQ